MSKSFHTKRKEERAGPVARQEKKKEASREAVKIFHPENGIQVPEKRSIVWKDCCIVFKSAPSIRPARREGVACGVLKTCSQARDFCSGLAILPQPLYFF